MFPPWFCHNTVYVVVEVEVAAFESACLFSIISDVLLEPVSYTHLRAHETREDSLCRVNVVKK